MASFFYEAAAAAGDEAPRCVACRKKIKPGTDVLLVECQAPQCTMSAAEGGGLVHATCRTTHNKAKGLKVAMHCKRPGCRGNMYAVLKPSKEQISKAGAGGRDKVAPILAAPEVAMRQAHERRDLGKKRNGRASAAAGARSSSGSRSSRAADTPPSAASCGYVSSQNPKPCPRAPAQNEWGVCNMHAKAKAAAARAATKLRDDLNAKAAAADKEAREIQARQATALAEAHADDAASKPTEATDNVADTLTPASAWSYGAPDAKTTVGGARVRVWHDDAKLEEDDHDTTVAPAGTSSRTPPTPSLDRYRTVDWATSSALTRGPFARSSGNAVHPDAEAPAFVFGDISSESDELGGGDLTVSPPLGRADPRSLVGPHFSALTTPQFGRTPGPGTSAGAARSLRTLATAQTASPGWMPARGEFSPPHATQFTAAPPPGLGFDVGDASAIPLTSAASGGGSAAPSASSTSPTLAPSEAVVSHIRAELLNTGQMADAVVIRVNRVGTLAGFIVVDVAFTGAFSYIRFPASVNVLVGQNHMADNIAVSLRSGDPVKLCIAGVHAHAAGDWFIECQFAELPVVSNASSPITATAAAATSAVTQPGTLAGRTGALTADSVNVSADASDAWERAGDARARAEKLGRARRDEAQRASSGFRPSTYVEHSATDVSPTDVTAPLTLGSVGWLRGLVEDDQPVAGSADGTRAPSVSAVTPVNGSRLSNTKGSHAVRRSKTNALAESVREGPSAHVTTYRPPPPPTPRSLLASHTAANRDSLPMPAQPGPRAVRVVTLPQQVPQWLHAWLQRFSERVSSMSEEEAMNACAMMDTLTAPR